MPANQSEPTSHPSPSQHTLGTGSDKPHSAADQYSDELPDIPATGSRASKRPLSQTNDGPSPRRLRTVTKKSDNTAAGKIKTVTTKEKRQLRPRNGKMSQRRKAIEEFVQNPDTVQPVQGSSHPVQVLERWKEEKIDPQELFDEPLLLCPNDVLSISFMDAVGILISTQHTNIKIQKQRLIPGHLRTVSLAPGEMAVHFHRSEIEGVETWQASFSKRGEPVYLIDVNQGPEDVYISPKVESDITKVIPKILFSSLFLQGTITIQIGLKKWKPKKVLFCSVFRN